MSVFGGDAHRLTMRSRDGSAMPDAGSQVWVAVAERAILRAAVAVFGFPLVGMVAGSAVGSTLGVTESAVAGLAGLGLAAGFMAGAFVIRRGVPTGAMLHDGYAERGVTLLNQAARVRSDARSDVFNIGKSRIT